MQESNREIVRAFFESWGTSYDGMIAGFRAAMTDDCFVQQTRAPDVHGLEGMIRFLDGARAAGVVETITVELRNLIVEGDTVVSERIDYMRDKAGKILATLPCVGIMEMRGGRIAVWRDYFDTADLQAGALDAVQTL